MDRRERIDSPHDMLLMALEGAQAQMWTALPAIIQSFDPVAMTCTVQPALQAEIQAPEGTASWTNLPVLIHCPVVFPSGGGCTLTFPLKNGDECLIVFSSRCIDAWWQQGGVATQAEFRMHDLSDGFVLPGVKSQPNVIPAVSTTATQLRSDDGTAVVSLDPASHTINIITPSVVNVTAPAINMGATGQTLLSLVTGAFMSLFNNHTHTTTTTGNPTSVPATPMTSAHITSTVKGA